MSQSDTSSSPIASARKSTGSLLLNILIASLVVVVCSLGYSLLDRHLLNPPVEIERAGPAAGEIIQLDVLNGCGVQGAATRFTAFLRERGYDVVEMKNYKTFDVDESLVIDRVGNLRNAERVAYALGISGKNVIQQLNQDYYVDVSVVIGKDYQTLKPSR